MRIPHRSLFLFMLTGLIFSTFHCDDMPLVNGECPENNYVIYSILSPEYKEQGVYVGKYFPYADPMDVSDATVTIRDSVHSWQLALAEPGYYKIDSTQMKPVPLTTYYLDVRTPDGQLFTARTTIPDTFHVIWPAKTDTVDTILHATFRRPVVDTTLICSTAKGGRLFGCWSSTNGWNVMPTSLPQTPTQIRFAFSIFESHLINMKLTLAALDSNLSDYAQENELGQIFKYKTYDSSRAGINISFRNAKGVFGSLRLLWHEVVIRNVFD